ncbi:Uncharacterised protein [uncultured archaeon]|nr:Uncharacterised protein [uncultured archaeon]
MIWKVIISISFVLALAYTGHASFDETVSDKAVFINKFSIENVDVKEFYTGEMQRINITIRNNWKLGVKDAYVTMLGDENIQISDSNKKYLGIINSSESKTVSFLVIINENAKRGVYMPKLNIIWEVDVDKYRSELGTEVTSGMFKDTLEFGIYNAGKRLENVGIFNISIDPRSLTPGKSAKINLNLTNNAKKPVKDLKFRLFLDPPFRYAAPQIFIYLPELNVDQTKGLTYYIDTDASAEEGTYKLKSIIEYSISDGSFIEDYDFNVDIVEGTPLQIERIDFKPDVIRPNADSEMIIELKNSGKSGIKDVKIVSYGGEGILNDVYKYAGSISPNQSKIVIFAINADKTTKLTTRGINLDISYIDSTGSAKKISRIIPIHILDTESIIPAYVTIFIAAIVIIFLLVSAVFILYYGRG